MILGIETSGPLTGVALLGPGVEAEAWCREPFSHVEKLNLLLGWLDEVFPLERVEAVALSLGPGFFTSLRVGAAAAKALALARGVKVVGVNTLEALLEEVEEPFKVAALDAKKGQVYAVGVKDGEVVIPMGIWDPEELMDAALRLGFPVFVGDGASKYGLEPNLGRPRPSPLTVAKLGLEALLRGEALDPLDFEPLYLREPDAVVNLRKS